MIVIKSINKKARYLKYLAFLIGVARGIRTLECMSHSHMCSASSPWPPQAVAKKPTTSVADLSVLSDCMKRTF